MSAPPAEPVTPDPPAGRVRPQVMTQAWTRLTYCHWAYDPADVARVLPPGLRPDVDDEGRAWVGLIPFAMRRVALLGTPPLPHLSSFLETNVRTYTVGPDGRRGVWFCTLEADRLLPVLVARSTYRLPYTWSRMRLAQRGDELDYRSARRWPAPRGTRSALRVRLGEEVGAADVAPLDHWLTARWGLHSRWWGDRLVWAPVEHERWPLRRAELLEVDADLVSAVGLPAPQGEPRVLHSEGVHVRIGPPRAVRR